MADDLESSAGTASLDTTTASQSAPSGPTDSGASVVEGQTEQPANDTTPAPGTDDESVEPEGGDGEDDAPRSEEEGKLSRSERRKLREQERIEAQVAERLAAKEREAATAAEQKKRTDEAAKAAKARIERLSQFVGAPDTVDKPGTISTIRAENATLYERLRTEIGTLTQDEFDGIDTKIRTNTARIERLNENQAMSREIEEFVWGTFSDDFASAAQFPELSDPAVRARYLGAQGGVRGALAVLREAIIAAKDTEIKALSEKHASALKAAEAETTSWRIRAGGEEVGDTSSNGTASVSGQLLTPSRYHAMSFEQRQKLKSTPEGRAQIDAMTQRSGVA